MKTALLISTFNWPEALNLVLNSVLNQSEFPDEILIADDGSTEETQFLIDEFKEKSNLVIKHIWQEDKGFRKSAILNKAIAQTNAQYIIEVDGDCILHKDFIKDHKKLALENHFLFGSRVNIQKEYLKKLFLLEKTNFNFFSRGIRKRTRALRIPYFALFYRGSDQLSKKLRGCNMSFFRENFIKVNGYNEDFEGWGKEDSELAIRLLNSGCLGKRIRYSGIVFHIWHNVKSKSRLQKNEDIQNLVSIQKSSFCVNGIDKYIGKRVKV
ncbi:glycosyltransferase family 2 protein [Aquimarina agarilytica]|uniref:glycosyltransferase family 2 protein n=1 Tax=Aquimarina agarilytica TaxID=1087449 RepID=UPI00028842B8|nr:glycosyltransferase family 2 protein [Aquimarina agarilytica]